MPDFSQHALGKQPPINKPALMLRDVLTGTVPATPAAADHFGRISDWCLGGNDSYGTCGPTSVANLLLLVTTYLKGQGDKVTDADIFELYRQSGNPGFDPDHYRPADDRGVNMQTMLEALLEHGIGADSDGNPYKPVAFAKIAPGDMDTLDKAVAIFGGVLLGLTLDVAQQNQAVWDYVARSAEWGGHAVLNGRYSDPAGTAQDRAGIITWAQPLDATRNFVSRQEDEAWVVIWPEQLGDEEFLEGVNVGALASAYEELTGRPFPVVTPPGPVPPPAPSGGADAALAAALTRWRTHHDSPAYLVKPADAWLEDHA